MSQVIICLDMRVSRTRFSGYCRLLSRLGQQAASSYGESQWGFVFHPEPFIAKSESGKWFFAVPFQIFYDKNHFTKFNLQNLHNLLFTLCAKTSKRKKNLQMLIFQNLFHKTSLFVRNCFFTIGKIQEHFTTGGLMMFCEL